MPPFLCFGLEQYPHGGAATGLALSEGDAAANVGAVNQGVLTAIFAVNADVTVTHLQGYGGNRRPAHAAVGFNVVFHAVIQSFRRDIAFTVNVDAVGQARLTPPPIGNATPLSPFFGAR